MSSSTRSKYKRGCPPVAWNSLQLPSRLQTMLAAGKQHSLDDNISIFEGFGSFHSENVEDLIEQDAALYKPPSYLPTFAKRLLAKSEIASLVGARMTDAQQSSTRVSPPPAALSLGRKRLRADVLPADGAISTSQLTTVKRRAIMEHNKLSGAGYSNDADEPTTDESDRSSVDEAPALFTFMIGCQTDAIERQLQVLMSRQIAPCELGAVFRAEHFTITPDIVFINHGAFGSTLAGAMLMKRLFEERIETEVVEFVDRELLPLIVYSIRSLSRFLHADPRQVVLLQNATFALNCAMRMIEKDDVVAFLDTEYLAVYKMMWFRCEEVGASLHEVALNKFLHNAETMGDDAALTAEICRQLPANCTVVVLDYITSTSALCFPIFTHIVPALRQRGITKIIVDGAHTPLQIDLNFNTLPLLSQPTVFVGNLHKWFSSPKSAGFFWVRKEDRDKMHSVVLSHGAGEGLLSEFIWDGTRDYGAYLSIPAIVDFWERQGCDRVRDYCSRLLASAAEMLTDAFGSRRVARHAPFMSLVELPEQLQDEVITAKYIQDSLHDIFRVEVPVKRVEGRYYLRISAFVYNTPEEYVYLREAILSITEKWMLSSERKMLEAQRVAAQASAASPVNGQPTVVPCDERIRRQGGCGVSGLDPTLKRKRTAKFA